MLVWLAFAILVIGIGALLYRPRVMQRLAVSNPLPTLANKPEANTSNSPGPVIPFQTEVTEDLSATIHSLAFSQVRFDYEILGPHLEVLTAAKNAVAHAVHEENYFPRRPALLPKLLRVLNAGDSSREEIVRLILQDPMLAGNVLKRANSVFYRQSDVATESVDRAVVILGSEGLRAPVVTAVMQPVFQLPRGFFDYFAPTTWELAQRTAAAAEAYARLNRTGDAFVAHLLGLLGGLGRIVLFRMTLDKYRTKNILPRAEVFVRVMRDHEQQLTRAVASAWELSPEFLASIDAQREQISPQHMLPLARTLYYANLCGALATLFLSGKYSQEDAHILLAEQGLSAESRVVMWTAATVQSL